MIDGMPRAPYYQQSRVEKYATSIADVKRELAKLDTKILRAEIDIQRYISTVPDSEIRMILQYRFVDCLMWRDVAQNLGGEKTEASVKATVKRFVKSIS